MYIARRLNDAQTLEDILTSAGVDYVVEADEYVGGLVFRTTRVGAFFYARTDSADLMREILRSNGYKPYEAGD